MSQWGHQQVSRTEMSCYRMIGKPGITSGRLLERRTRERRVQQGCGPGAGVVWDQLLGYMCLYSCCPCGPALSDAICLSFSLTHFFLVGIVEKPLVIIEGTLHQGAGDGPFHWIRNFPEFLIWNTQVNATGRIHMGHKTSLSLFSWRMDFPIMMWFGYFSKYLPQRTWVIAPCYTSLVDSEFDVNGCNSPLP